MFAPAFRRNSRWSSVTPVPDVGDDNTPWEEVDAFYVFWFNFRYVGGWVGEGVYVRLCVHVHTYMLLIYTITHV